MKKEEIRKRLEKLNEQVENINMSISVLEDIALDIMSEDFCKEESILDVEMKKVSMTDTVGVIDIDEIMNEILQWAD